MCKNRVFKKFKMNARRHKENAMKSSAVELTTNGKGIDEKRPAYLLSIRAYDLPKYLF